jgi:hypothetical protein
MRAGKSGSSGRMPAKHEAQSSNPVLPKKNRNETISLAWYTKKENKTKTLTVRPQPNGNTILKDKMTIIHIKSEKNRNHLEKRCSLTNKYFENIFNTEGQTSLALTPALPFM